MRNIRRTRRSGRNAMVLALAIALGSGPWIGEGQRAAAAVLPYKLIPQAVNVEGKRGSVDAFNDAGTTYVALRSLNGLIGLTTGWNQETRTASVTGRGRELTLDLKNGETVLNGQRINNLNFVVQDGATYIPIRFLLERMGYGISYDPATKEIGIEAIAENDLTISTAFIKEEDDKKSLVVSYPQLLGFQNATVQSKINALLKSEAELNAQSGRESLQEALGDDGTYAPDNPLAFEGIYTITYNEKNKLSLYVDYYIYTGGAHGSTVRVPYTFDLTTGGRIGLKEAAGNNAKYVKIINDNIKSQIKARKLSLLNPFQTIEPDREFFLKHSGIVIYFGQYEYTPYALGMPEFEIPYKAFL